MVTRWVSSLLGLASHACVRLMLTINQHRMLSSFYRWGSQITERLNKFLKVTELTNDHSDEQILLIKNNIISILITMTGGTKVPFFNPWYIYIYISTYLSISTSVLYSPSFEKQIIGVSGETLLLFTGDPCSFVRECSYLKYNAVLHSSKCFARYWKYRQYENQNKVRFQEAGR